MVDIASGCVVIGDSNVDCDDLRIAAAMVTCLSSSSARLTGGLEQDIVDDAVALASSAVM